MPPVARERMVCRPDRTRSDRHQPLLDRDQADLIGTSPSWIGTRPEPGQTGTDRDRPGPSQIGFRGVGKYSTTIAFLWITFRNVGKTAMERGVARFVRGGILC